MSPSKNFGLLEDCQRIFSLFENFCPKNAKFLAHNLLCWKFLVVSWKIATLYPACIFVHDDTIRIA